MINYLLLLHFLFATFHDFHVSRADINFNADEQIVEVSAQIFIDDLELAMKAFSNDTLHLGTLKEKAISDSLIVLYLNRHFLVSNTDNPFKMNWLGKEVSDDLAALWVYFYYDWDGQGQLQLVNDILMEVYDDQKNIIDYNVSGKRNTLLFSRGNTYAELK